MSFLGHIVFSHIHTEVNVTLKLSLRLALWSLLPNCPVCGWLQGCYSCFPNRVRRCVWERETCFLWILWFASWVGIQIRPYAHQKIQLKLPSFARFLPKPINWLETTLIQKLTYFREIFCIPSRNFAFVQLRWPLQKAIV